MNIYTVCLSQDLRLTNHITEISCDLIGQLQDLPHVCTWSMVIVATPFTIKLGKYPNSSGIYKETTLRWPYPTMFAIFV